MNLHLKLESLGWETQQGLLCCCSVAQWYPTLCDPMDCSMPGLPQMLCSDKEIMELGTKEIPEHCDPIRNVRSLDLLERRFSLAGPASVRSWMFKPYPKCSSTCFCVFCSGATRSLSTAEETFVGWRWVHAFPCYHSRAKPLQNCLKCEVTWGSSIFIQPSCLCRHWHDVPGLPGTTGDPEPFRGLGREHSCWDGWAPFWTARRSDPVRMPTSHPVLWRSQAPFCLSASWIPLEDLTHIQPTYPGIEAAPFISTWSSASSPLSYGCKLQRHFLFRWFQAESQAAWVEGRWGEFFRNCSRKRESNSKLHRVDIQSTQPWVYKRLVWTNFRNISSMDHLQISLVYTPGLRTPELWFADKIRWQSLAPTSQGSPVLLGSWEFILRHWTYLLRWTCASLKSTHHSNSNGQV